MATIPCRECGRSLGSDSIRCPHCGTPEPDAGGPSGRKAAPVAIGCLAFVIVAAVVGVAGGNGSGPAPAPTRTLPASLRLTSTQLHVTNDGDVPWTNCTVEINAGFRRGYQQQTPTIAPGETVAGGLRAFTRSERRFDPGTQRVENASVRCDTPRGRAYYYRSF